MRKLQSQLSITRKRKQERTVTGRGRKKKKLKKKGLIFVSKDKKISENKSITKILRHITYIHSGS